MGEKMSPIESLIAFAGLAINQQLDALWKTLASSRKHQRSLLWCQKLEPLYFSVTEKIYNFVILRKYCHIKDPILILQCRSNRDRFSKVVNIT
jgi:hypothetical protein